MEVMDEEGGLLGEVALCPTCLKAFKGQAVNKASAGGETLESEEIASDIVEYDDDELGINDYKAMGYQVESIL